jgi:hypothetical protein
VIEKFSCQRSAWMDHGQLAGGAVERDEPAVEQPLEHLVSLSATPLLFQPQQTEVMQGSTFDDHCQRISPVSIDSAKTSLAPVLTKATPSSTSGCANRSTAAARRPAQAVCATRPSGRPRWAG